MSVNQVLNAVDEIINGSPKYTITPNGDGTNGIELANEVTQQGTPLNKACLDKIDNVLSYLTPSVEKIPYSVEKTNKAILESNSNSQSSNTTYVGQLNGNEDGTTLSLEYNFYRIYENATSRSSWTPTQMQTVFNYITNNPTAENGNYIQLRTSNYILLDFGKTRRIKIGYTMSQSYLKFEYGINSPDTTFNYTKSDTYNVSELTTRYIKISGTGSTAYINSLDFEFSDTGLSYKNQFTLDNNGNTFTNNQRLLIETPKAVGEVSGSIFGEVGNNTYSSNTEYTNETCTYLEDKTARINFKVNNFYNGSSSISSISKNDLNQLFKNNSLGNYICNLKKSGNNYIKFETINIDKCKLKLGFYQSNIRISISNDDISYTNLYVTQSDGSSKIESFDIPQNTKYIKIAHDSSLGGDSADIQVVYLDDIKYLAEVPAWDVESNTINGVPCDTLLQPSTKYELVYNESEDKFDVNDGVLYDITLKEAVNQVDLTGINNRIKIGSIYRVIAIGKALGGNGNLVIGNAPSTVITTILTYTAVEFYKTNEGGIVVGIPHTGGAVQGTFIDNESISISNSRQFDEGARIIIKEVA